MLAINIGLSIFYIHVKTIIDIREHVENFYLDYIMMIDSVIGGCYHTLSGKSIEVIALTWDKPIYKSI